MNRKSFLALVASAFAVLSGVFLFKFFFAKKITGKVVGPDRESGHGFRDRKFSDSPKSNSFYETIIVGGGISGLSASYYLSKSGYSEYALLEMEDSTGGNSRFGENLISKYPWGSHYLPQPTSQMSFLSGFLKDAGVIVGINQNGEPKFNEKYICFDPEERLFIHGRWQDGLFPKYSSTKEVLNEKERFDSLMGKWRKKIGRDGRKAFMIPVDFSSKDPEILKLDQISFLQYLSNEGFKSKELLWFAEYATRDDYGSSLSNTSAWAGIHYYASRPVDSKGEEFPTLTWPEGNGFLASKLRSMSNGKIQTNEVVYKITRENSKWKIFSFDKNAKITKSYTCKSLIYSLPQFTRKYILGDFIQNDFVYSPWMVANLTVSKIPEGVGTPPAWDNVIYKSASLGYIISTHQSFRYQEKRSVLTYYLPFPEDDTKTIRKKLEKEKWEDWKKIILKDLKRCHREIGSIVQNIDVMIHAHAMIRPIVGFIWGNSRKAASESIDNLHFAHSDLSGISIFEEAHYRGFVAAQKILQSVRR